MDILTELENLKNLKPSEREDSLHGIKQEVITACKDCTNRMQVTEKVESLLKIKEKTQTGFAYNERNSSRFGSLGLELINAVNEKFQVTKIREKL